MSSNDSRYKLYLLEARNASVKNNECWYREFEKKLQIDDIIVDLIDDHASWESFILNNSKVDCNCLQKSLKYRSQGRWSKS